MSKLFTPTNLQDDFFIWNYHLDIVVHSGSIQKLTKYQPISGCFCSQNLKYIIDNTTKMALVLKCLTGFGILAFY